MNTNKFLVRVSSYAKFKGISYEAVRKQIKKGLLRHEIIDGVSFVYLSKIDRISYPNETFSNQDRFHLTLMDNDIIGEIVTFKQSDCSYRITSTSPSGECIGISIIDLSKITKLSQEHITCFFKESKFPLSPYIEDLEINGTPFLEFIKNKHVPQNHTQILKESYKHGE